MIMFQFKEMIYKNFKLRLRIITNLGQFFKSYVHADFKSRQKDFFLILQISY